MLELGVADTKGDVDLLKQRIKKAMGDLQGHIEDPQEGMQGFSVHTVSHKEFMAFQDKVLSVLTRLESRVTSHEGSEDSHTTGWGRRGVS